MAKVFKNKELWYFSSDLSTLDNCISLSLLVGEILGLGYITFEVLVLKQTCIIVIVKTAKLKEQKN